MMIGFSFPIRLMIIGAILEKTKNIIIKGSWTFAASTALPPNPSGIGFLTSCTIAGYAMNIVIPVAVAIMYEGMRVLSFSNLMSTNGDVTLLSMKTKTLNEMAETRNAIPTSGNALELIPLCKRVNAIRNEIIVIESTKAPFISKEGDDWC